MLAAVLVQLLRSGAIGAPDLLAAAGTLDDDGRAFLEALIVEARAPAASHWRADQARSRFHIVRPIDA